MKARRTVFSGALVIFWRMRGEVPAAWVIVPVHERYESGLRDRPRRPRAIPHADPVCPHRVRLRLAICSRGAGAGAAGVGAPIVPPICSSHNAPRFPLSLPETTRRPSALTATVFIRPSWPVRVSSIVSAKKSQPEPFPGREWIDDLRQDHLQRAVGSDHRYPVLPHALDDSGDPDALVLAQGWFAGHRLRKSSAVVQGDQPTVPVDHRRTG